jgi:ABC-type transporter MlaC component
MTRAAFLAAATASMFAVATPALAARNSDAEQYVQANAAEALRTLGDRSVAAGARRQTFHTLMARFADMPRIAAYVLGRYSTQLRADAGLRSDWTRTFQEYSIAVYEDRLER